MIMLMQLPHYTWIVLLIIMGKDICRKAQDQGEYKQKENWKTYCPTNCSCLTNFFKFFQNSMNIVNCSSLELSYIPLEIPIETEVLLLNNNQIWVIKKLPTAKNLKYLDLSNNLISQLDNHFLFASLTKLEYLGLQNNKLKKLLHGSFSGMTALESLDLSFNKLHSIEVYAFGGINQLQYLRLNGNQLTELNKLWFFTMENLEDLNLSQNTISTLPDNLFENLSKLTTLRILNNKLKKIERNAFEGLTTLSVLDISNNLLNAVPTQQLQWLSNLNIFVFDGNAVTKVDQDDFSDMNINEISISFMPNLRVVEAASFQRLKELVSLQLHDNPNLLFIHPQAFQEVPKLTTLYLHNNRLKTISADIKVNLPALTSIHLYHNPLQCDCNAYWIKQHILEFRKKNYTSVYFNEANKLECDEPNKGIPLLQSALPRVCPPTTLPLFKDHYNLSIADTLQLECHALGIPRPHIQWLVPESVGANDTFPHKRVEIINNTTLLLRYVLTSDSGTYICKATNAIGLDTSSTAVKVNNKSVRLIPYGISSEFITITWNGTEERTSINDYQLQYGECPNICHAHIIHFGPFSPRRYTVKDLKPLTTYQFCIVYKSEYEQHKVDCINLTTTRRANYQRGITKVVTEEIIIGVCVSLACAILLICTIALCRKFTRRKDYEKTTGHDKTETLSNIPLENLYHPPSTPVCSSRTALIDQNE